MATEKGGVARVPLSRPALQLLLVLQREIEDANHAETVAVDFARLTRERNIAVQAALCSSLGIAEGSMVTLDSQAGCFVVQTVEHTASSATPQSDKGS